MVPSMATKTKVTVVHNEITSSGRERSMSFVVFLLLESESENRSDKTSSSTGTSDGKKIPLRCSFHWQIGIFCSERDPWPYGCSFLVNDREDWASNGSFEKEDWSTGRKKRGECMISFVFHQRWTSLCLQFDHSLDTFRDEEEQFPKAIVSKQTSRTFILPKISSPSRVTDARRAFSLVSLERISFLAFSVVALSTLLVVLALRRIVEIHSYFFTRQHERSFTLHLMFVFELFFLSPFCFAVYKHECKRTCTWSDGQYRCSSTCICFSVCIDITTRDQFCCCLFTKLNLPHQKIGTIWPWALR